MPYTSGPARPAIATLSVACALLACSRPAPPPAAQRLIEPPPGSESTAALPRTRIGTESRYLLARREPVVLRAQEDVMLDSETVSVDVPLPSSLAAAAALRIDAWVSVRDPAAPSETLAALREGRRVELAADSLVLRETPAGGSATLTISVPDALRNRPGLLTVVARPLAPSPIERVETTEVTIPAESRLHFGYAIEEPGWAAGWPPVIFRVRAPGEAAALFERRIDPAADPRDRRWFEATVDLRTLAGRTVRLTFEAEVILGVPGATVDRSFAVMSNPVIVPAGLQPAASRPNVVLISLDTLRARSVSAYGCSRPTTPSLDRRIAAAGALVRSAVTPVPFTPPAHMSMLTGLEPCVHGVYDLRVGLAPEHVTMAERLRAHGYATAAFTEDAYLIAGHGFDRGFDSYAENRSEETASPGFGAETFAAASAWLAARDPRPFFLFIHTYQVHGPYVPPRAYRVLFSDQDGNDEKARALTDYEREVRYTDDILAGFLDTLAALGLENDTILAVTSDHGEGFGEHFWTGHGFDLHDEALLVPLVIRAPRLVRPGRVVEEEVGLVDIMPTLLALTGVPAPTGIQGQSFASLLTGTGTAFRERPLFASIPGPPPTAKAIRTRSYKYIKFLQAPGGEMLYDLDADPRETANRSGVDARRLAEARTALEEADAACGRWQAAQAVRPANPPAELGQPDWLVNRQDIERKLRSLGYVQ